jgi:hypothetical protein
VIEATVKRCLHRVHEETQLGLFDAFWNAASGKVENNAHLNRFLAPGLFAFNKCMAEEGVPFNYNK